MKQKKKRNQADQLPVWRYWFAVFLFFAMLYGFTAQRSVSWQDSGEYQWRTLQFDLVGSTGLARSHPLYIVVGKLFALADRESMVFVLNIFSGVGMAIAMATLTIIICRITGRLYTGLCIAGVLGVSHAVWWLSTIAEVYTWSVAGLTVEILLLLLLLEKPCRKTFMLLALVSGVGLSIHNLALLSLPVYLSTAVYLTWKHRLNGQDWLHGLLCWILGAGVYLGLVIGMAAKTGDFVGTIGSALVGNYGAAVFNVTSVSIHFKANLVLSLLSFMNVLLPLAIIGWFSMARQQARAVKVCLGFITVIQILFFVRYPVPDQFTFILPTMVMISIAAGAGLRWAVEKSRRIGVAAVVLCVMCMVGQPIMFSLLPGVIRRSYGDVRQKTRLFRDEVRYWVVPWKHNEDSAEKFAMQQLDSVPPGLWLSADSTEIYPLLLVQELKGVGKAVEIIPEDSLK